MKYLKILIVIFSLSCKSVGNVSNIVYRFEMVEEDLDIFVKPSAQSSNFMLIANSLWYSYTPIEETMDDCYRNFILTRNGAQKTVDTRLKKNLRLKALNALFDCQYNLPDKFCDYLNLDFVGTVSIPYNFNEHLVRTLNEYMAKANFELGLDKKIKLNLLNSPKDNNHLFGKKENIYITKELIRAVYLYEFSQVKREFVRLQVNRMQSLNDYHKINRIGDNWSKKLYDRILAQFKFAIYHEVAHKYLDSKFNHEQQTETFCDCIATYIFKELNEKVYYGLFEKLLYKNQGYCDFWEIPTNNARERINKSLKFRDSTQVYERECEDILAVLNDM